MAEIRFTVHGTPQQRGSKSPWVPRRKDGSFATTATGRAKIVVRDANVKSESWMTQVRESAAAAYTGDLLLGPVMLDAVFYFSRPQSHYGTGKNAGQLVPSAPLLHCKTPDLSKLLRALEDALTKVIWLDDKQVVRYGPGTGRRWTTTGDCVVVTVSEL